LFNITASTKSDHISHQPDLQTIHADTLISRLVATKVATFNKS